MELADILTATVVRLVSDTTVLP